MHDDAFSESERPEGAIWPGVVVAERDVIPGRSSDPYLEIAAWPSPITFFVGRNGSGKSRTARRIAQEMQGRLLSTDRLVGLMSFASYGSGSQITDYKGLPLSDSERKRIEQSGARAGLANWEMYALKDEPDVALRVAAFIRRVLHRDVELRESAGYLDPYMRLGSTSYSLLRDEGHGLRELVVLLISTYRADASLLVVDEPELHLHPSMARIWLQELRRECQEKGKRALIVTHDPGLIRPRTLSDLGAIFHFSSTRRPKRFSEAVLDAQRARAESSLAEYPALVSDLVFSPRPVLVEGPTDAVALSVALQRLYSHEVVEQTDFVPCGNSTGVATWFEIAKSLGLDVRGVVDLDAIFTNELRRVLDSIPEVAQTFAQRLLLPKPRTSDVLAPLVTQAGAASVDANPKARARWLSEDDNLASQEAKIRRDLVLEVARGVGLWLHPQGTLEDVLGIETKSREAAVAAAQSEGPLDDVANWGAYQLDPAGDVQVLLSTAVARVCQAIQNSLLLDGQQVFDAPVGPTAEADARLVDVTPPGGSGLHRVTVKAPEPFIGWFVDFDVNTPPTALSLRAPDTPPER